MLLSLCQDDPQAASLGGGLAGPCLPSLFPFLPRAGLRSPDVWAVEVEVITEQRPLSRMIQGPRKESKCTSPKNTHQCQMQLLG